MSRNIFTLAGALVAFAILLSASFAGLASAEGTVMGALPNDTVMAGQEYNIDLKDRLLASGVNSAFFDPASTSHKHTWINYEVPSWLTVSGLTHLGGEFYRSTDGHLYLTGTPKASDAGSHEIRFGFFIGTTGPTQPQGPEYYTITVQLPAPNYYDAGTVISIETGQALNIDILPHFPATVVNSVDKTTMQTSLWGEGAQKTAYRFFPAQTSYPAWMTVTQGVTNVPKITLTGTPTVAGTYQVSLGLGFSLGGDVASMNAVLRATVQVNDPVPPTPYTVTLISDPVAEPSSISTSAGTVTLTNGAGTVNGGTIMYEPTVTRDRYVIHRWTDAAGNTYDWTKPVAKDLTLTAEWREHFSATVEGNTVTVTISADLPSQYNIHQIDWGDNTVNAEMSHKYAAAGDYVVKVRSGQWGDYVSSSTIVTVSTVTVTPTTFQVTFNSQGGSAVSALTVQEGDRALEPTAPARDGYAFAGWLHNGVKYDWSKPVTSNIVLSASWASLAPVDDKDPPADDDDDKDEEPKDNTLLIALGALTIISLIITLATRSPYAFGLTIVLALIELALLMLGLGGVIA